MSEFLDTILVTRKLSDEDIEFAHSLNLDIVCLPMLSFEFPEDWDDAIKSLTDFQADSWIFTSKNGVLGFEELMSLVDLKFPKTNIFAVGKKTAGELFRLGYKPFMPDDDHHNAAGLAELIVEMGKTQNAIHFCGNKRRPELAEGLGKANITVKEIQTYRTVTHPEKEVGQEFRNILFYSPSAAEAYYENHPVSKETTHFAIGPTTAKALFYLGARNIVIADEPTTQALLKKVHEHLSQVHEN